MIALDSLVRFVAGTENAGARVVGKHGGLYICQRKAPDGLTEDGFLTYMATEDEIEPVQETDW